MESILGLRVDLRVFLCLQADENLRSELEADVKEECAKIGHVDLVKVRVFVLIFYLFLLSDNNVLFVIYDIKWLKVGA